MSRQNSINLDQKNSKDNILNGSEENNKENLEVKEPQKEKDLISNEAEKKHKGPSKFGIEALELEELMGKYKERGADFQDLLYFQKKPVSTLLSELKTDPEIGIKDFEGREDEFGSNKVFVEPVPHFCHFVWEALKDLMVRILILAAIVSIVLRCTFSDDPSKDWVYRVSIVVEVLIIVLVGFIIDYQKEQKFHELNEVRSEGAKYKLIRNGQPEDHISDDLLVGYLIIINYGDIMAADIILIEGNGIKTDESALTGE